MSTPDPAHRRRLARRAAGRRSSRRRRRAALGLRVVMVAAVAVGVATRGADPDLGAGPGPAAASDDGEAVPRETEPVRSVAREDARRVSVAAVGDTVMGSPPFGLPPDEGRTFFDPVDEHLAGDVVLGNLEGVLAEGGASKCGPDSTDCFAFRMPPSYAERMAEAGFTVMNLANNHSHDFGPAGLEETAAVLGEAGVGTTGRPGEVAWHETDGLRIAVLGFAPYSWAESLLDIPGAAERVREVDADADIVVVTFHGGAEGADHSRVPGGGEEHLGEPRGEVHAFSHAVIDAGADLVVGHGPHVLRGMEVYRGRLIAYSLGNFAGYEVFALGGALSESAVLRATLLPDGRLLGGRIHPTRLVPPGTPAPGGTGVETIRRLSREDFGETAPRITEDGVLRPPEEASAESS